MIGNKVRFGSILELSLVLNVFVLELPAELFIKFSGRIIVVLGLELDADGPVAAGEGFGLFDEGAGGAAAAVVRMNEEIVEDPDFFHPDRGETGVELGEADAEGTRSEADEGKEDDALVAADALSDVFAGGGEFGGLLVELSVGIEEGCDEVDVAEASPDDSNACGHVSLLCARAVRAADDDPTSSTSVVHSARRPPGAISFHRVSFALRIFASLFSSTDPTMKIHEYQARELLVQAGIPVPPSQTIDSIEQAAPAFKAATTGGGRAVIKAQVHAGGRGKAGFVKLVGTPEEATQAARFMLTTRMKSPQTPAEGLEVRKLLVGSAVDIKHEYYLAITTDRKTRRNVLIASREGGVEIETVAHDRPEAIIKEPLHPLLGLQGHQARRVAFALGFEGKQVGQAVDIMQKLAKLYVDKDCTLAEINPLVLTGSAASPAAASQPSGQLLAIDAKFNFDDNGMFRHADLRAMADPTEENPAEVAANKFGLTYIALDGTIGCLVNGAGLAMATMDIIKLHGKGKGPKGADGKPTDLEPANFLDVGGGATEEAVTAAFSIILSDPTVKAVMVNIFGGIMKCDVIAQGIINAARGFKNKDGTVGFKVPLIVRLEGTNVEAGRALLDGAKKDILTMQAATDLTDAAKKVCASVR